MGRWEEDFPDDCTLPWDWVGSVAILEEFMKTKKTVEFGQCWVFSGLVTTRAYTTYTINSEIIIINTKFTHFLF